MMPHAQITARQYSPTDFGTVLGPLTTTFTPPDHCFTVPPNGYEGQTCSSDGTAYWDPNCFPTATITPFPTNGQVGADGFYSPALVCPSGFSTACQNSNGGGSFTFAFPTRPAETVVGCCPTGWECLDEAALCSSQIEPTPFSLPFDSCSGGTSQTPTTTYSLTFVVAPMIQMNWQSTDISTSTPSSSSSSSGSSSSAGGAATSAPVSGPQPTPVSKKSDTGAIAGGVVGGVVGLALLVLIPVFILRSRRRKAKAAAAGGGGGSGAVGAAADESEWEKPELDAATPQQRQELEEAGQRHELLADVRKQPDTVDAKEATPLNQGAPAELQG